MSKQDRHLCFLPPTPGRQRNVRMERPDARIPGPERRLHRPVRANLCLDVDQSWQTWMGAFDARQIRYRRCIGWIRLLVACGQDWHFGNGQHDLGLFHISDLLDPCER